MQQGGTFELSATGAQERGGLSSPGAWIGLGGLLVTGLMIALAAAHTELLLPASLRPVPGCAGRRIRANRAQHRAARA